MAVSFCIIRGAVNTRIGNWTHQWWKMFKCFIISAKCCTFSSTDFTTITCLSAYWNNTTTKLLLLVCFTFDNKMHSIVNAIPSNPTFFRHPLSGCSACASVWQQSHHTNHTKQATTPGHIWAEPNRLNVKAALICPIASGSQGNWKHHQCTIFPIWNMKMGIFSHFRILFLNLISLTNIFTCSFVVTEREVPCRSLLYQWKNGWSKILLERTLLLNSITHWWNFTEKLKLWT